jgi:hypothetical protein
MIELNHRQSERNDSKQYVTAHHSHERSENREDQRQSQPLFGGAHHHRKCSSSPARNASERFQRPHIQNQSANWFLSFEGMKGECSRK